MRIRYVSQGNVTSSLKNSKGCSNISLKMKISFLNFKWRDLCLLLQKMQMSHRSVQWLTVLLLVVFTSIRCQQSERWDQHGASFQSSDTKLHKYISGKVENDSEADRCFPSSFLQPSSSDWTPADARPQQKHPESEETHLAVQRHRGAPHGPGPLRCFRPHKGPGPGSQSGAGPRCRGPPARPGAERPQRLL